MDFKEKFNDFFNPNSLHHKLITASIFIAVYENFKSTIVDNVKTFYWSGIEDGKEVYDDYEREVLSKIQSKKNRQIRATMLWYKENGAIEEKDIEKFKDMTDLRDMFGHDLLNKMFDGLPENTYELYLDMIILFQKISKWWVKEIEIPTSCEFSPEDYDNIDLDEIVPINLELIKIMTDIAFTGNEEYFESLTKQE